MATGWLLIKTDDDLRLTYKASARMDLEKPIFLGKGVFSWNDLGYQFSDPQIIDLQDPETLKSDNPWVILAAVLERAKDANFEPLPLLVKCVLSSKDALLWRAGFELLGDAGSPALIRELMGLRQKLFEKNDAAYQRHICYTLFQSHLLWAVPPMLDFYLKAEDRNDCGIITVLLSRLLEDSYGPVAAATLPDRQYHDLVTRSYVNLSDKLGGDDVPVLFGERFSVLALTEHLYKNLRVGNPDRVEIQSERHQFEAATGINCSAFYQGGQLEARRATTIIEDFLLAAGPDQYEDGVRYFFGHEILERPVNRFGATSNSIIGK